MSQLRILKTIDMKTSQDSKTIQELVDLFEHKMIIANPEYQRGIVWSEDQQKRLIDSLMRGFTLPLIYLHYRRESFGSMIREGMEIIDGQQRLTAIHRYVKGAFRLFDPQTENNKAKFPLYLRDQECPWAGKLFRDLSAELQCFLLNTKLLIARIESDDNNEIRDLFVRLQAGSALNPQERRDALPGGMNEFILSLGGKPSIPEYPGHDFFKEIMGARPDSDRGRTRQLAAQITSLLIAQHSKVGETLPDITARHIDQLYYENLDFDPNGKEARKIWGVFDLLHKLLRDGKRPKLRGHDAIHAALLVDRLGDDFSPAWQEEFPQALDAFLLNLKGSNKSDESEPKFQYWTQYGMWNRTNSDRGENIQKRHSFYLEKMLEKMPSTKLRDPVRHFNEETRELIYLQQRKTCSVCNGEVTWQDAEVHHVEEHQYGGRTSLENAALVHKICHPKSARDVKEFATKWQEKNRIKHLRNALQSASN